MRPWQSSTQPRTCSYSPRRSGGGVLGRCADAAAVAHHRAAHCCGAVRAPVVSGFSAEWLSLRERADADARSAAIAARLARWCTGRGALRVGDLGCGTGASVRALGPLLGERQAWHIIDDDPDLLRSARTILSCWADRSEAIANGLMLHKAGRLISVALEEADLDGALPRVLEKGADVVTAF